MRISDWSSDVCSSDLLTTLILPFPCAQLAFYIDLAALAQEAFSDIDQAFRENSDSVPFGPVLALARIPILPAFAGRDADIADLAAILEAANFRLRAKIPDQNHLVDAACHIVSRSEEHTSELQSLMRISYAVFCLKKKNKKQQKQTQHT